MHKYWWPILSFIFIYCVSNFLSIFFFTCAPFFFFTSPSPQIYRLLSSWISFLNSWDFICTDWIISEAVMLAYFTYRYYTAKQNVRGEENGRNREEAYLQAQCSKWENVLRHITFLEQVLTYTVIYMHHAKKEKKARRVPSWQGLNTSHVTDETWPKLFGK